MSTSQLILELSLIGTMLLVTGVFLVRSYDKTDGVGTKVQKILTGLLGAFMVMAGTVKFFDPFTTMFAKQIALSELPFPTLSRWLGQLGEIFAGLLLLAVMIGNKALAAPIKDRAMQLSTLLTTAIMIVAVYVHLLPSVPAEVLPLQSKPPVMTLIILGLAWLNAFLYFRKK
ncbi:DoxX family protein [Pseudoalteromonas agarivorans]|uniref:DoxX family protein n=1 Tax=Pseudoalteromonas agarivorans TaxID=176102 RepID=UPI000BB521CB|nr:DoxX family protein [Pseudoalteromonas agarivorans]